VLDKPAPLPAVNFEFLEVPLTMKTQIAGNNFESFTQFYAAEFLLLNRTGCKNFLID
jgi:hypothetical protein